MKKVSKATGKKQKPKNHLLLSFIILLLVPLALVTYKEMASKKPTQSQYVLKEDKQLYKEPVTAPVEAGDTFAQLAELDYNPGRYQVLYPYGFTINYSPNKFEAEAPGGGKVVVEVTGNSFSVTTETAGVSKDQAMMLQAAAKVVNETFQFVDSPPLGDRRRFL